MNKIILVFTFLLSIFLVGCQPQVICNKPYIPFGTSCCLDQNNNSICDVDETKLNKNNSEVIILPEKDLPISVNEFAKRFDEITKYSEVTLQNAQKLYEFDLKSVREKEEYELIKSDFINLKIFANNLLSGYAKYIEMVSDLEQYYELHKEELDVVNNTETILNSLKKSKQEKQEKLESLEKVIINYEKIIEEDKFEYSEDTCIQIKGIEKLSYSEQQQEIETCYTGRYVTPAVQNKDVSFCEKIYAESYGGICYGSVAIEMKSFTVCDKLVARSYSAKGYLELLSDKDICYFIYAKYKLQNSVCLKIQNKQLQKECSDYVKLFQ